jgi:HEAT repeat protein
VRCQKNLAHWGERQRLTYLLSMNPDDPTFGDVPYELILKLYPDTRAWEIWKPSPDDQCLAALDEIEAKRFIGCLPHLAPLVVTGTEAVQNRTAKVIAGLLESNVAQTLSVLAQGLHRLVHYETPAATAMNGIKRDLVWGLRITTDFEWAVFGLLSFHGNGWVREAAIDRLRPQWLGREIPFLLYRSNDWVSLVSQKAADLIRVRLANVPVRQFSDQLAVVFQLRSRQRGYFSDLQAQISERVAREEQIEFLVQRADEAATVGYRRWLLALATSSANTRPEAAALSEKLRRDRDPIVRGSAWSRIWTERPTEIDLTEGLDDPWSAIRRRCLEVLCDINATAYREVLRMALFDGSSMVRATARYFLKTIGDQEVIEIYRRRLTSTESMTPAALFGIFESGTKQDADLIRPFLTNQRVAIRRAAVVTVGGLDASRFLPEIKIALWDESRGVSKAARQILEKHPQSLTREFLFDLLDEKRPLHVRRAAIWLIRAIGKWERIVMLLEAISLAPEFNDTFREEITRWLQMYNRSFVAPAGAQLVELRRLASSREKMLTPEIVRELEQIAAIRH